MNYDGFDWKHPDYTAVFKQRLDLYNQLRAHPERIPAMKLYYRDHIADFIDDWGVTFDPRKRRRAGKSQNHYTTPSKLNGPDPADGIGFRLCDKSRVLGRLPGVEADRRGRGPGIEVEPDP